MGLVLRVHEDGQLAEPLDVEKLEGDIRATAAIAREDFYAYRCFMHRDMLRGWWQYMVAQELQTFYKDWRAGKRPVLILQAPPQHGKTWQVTDFVSWCAGKHPDTNYIYASYSEDLGLKANTYLQRNMGGDLYKMTFPNTRLNDAHASSQEGKWARNSFHFEFVGQKGSFRNCTVNGQINGLGLGFGLIDDPIKGRAEAQSLVLRDKVWGWLTDDFFGRFTDDAGLIMMMTRWHVDDPAGRLLQHFPHARICRYPAIAERDEEFRDQGEPLFPELKSLEFLNIRKKVLTQAGWMSIYQQSPIVIGGDLFPVDCFQIAEAIPNKKEIKRSVRYWDKAGTEGGTGAMTAGVLMHELMNDTYFIEHVVAGRWSALQREERILQVARLDNSGRRVETWVEQEPGSGGKESAESTIRKLRGFVCKADKVTGSKEIRAEPYAAQVQGKNVYLLKASWNRDFLDQHELFPNGKLKDVVDACGGAFGKLTVRESRYDHTMRWVRG
jgi:predicted phage terminase large subunit-like protein